MGFLRFEPVAAALGADGEQTDGSFASAAGPRLCPQVPSHGLARPEESVRCPWDLCGSVATYTLDPSVDAARAQC
jgi:hypothetical protein